MNFDPLSKDYPRILVHSLHDKSYPNIQPDEFGWFRTNLLGFYQEGLEIYVDHEKILLEIDTGEWTTVARGPQDFTLPNCYELAYIRRIGKIHISKIKDINYDGDKYYSDVHIYCDFKNYILIID